MELQYLSASDEGISRWSLREFTGCVNIKLKFLETEQTLILLPLKAPIIQHKHLCSKLWTVVPWVAPHQIWTRLCP